MAETQPPRDIRLFEALQFGSIFVGLMHQFAISDDSLLGPVFSAACIAVLTFAVSRRRKNWARWVLTAGFVLGLLIMAWLFGSAMLEGGYPIITIVVWLAQAIAVVLLFTKQSSDWVQMRPNN